GGMYISHLRNEGERLLEAVDELIAIARRAHVRGEIYHLKQAGRVSWGKLPAVVERVEAARAEGLAISAGMYPYTARATGLNASMPPWVQEGGFRSWVERLRDGAVRQRLAGEMRAPGTTWENLYEAAGSAEKVLLVSFKNEKLKPLTGKTLAAVAAMRGRSPEETAMDLVVEDESRLSAFPCDNLRLARRGRIARGFFADVVIFDPATIRDHATYERPHRYATGVAHVFVNGTPVLRDGEHTGAMPGRVLTPRRD